MPGIFQLDAARLRKVMFVGAHADDIEIGCGGAVRSLIGRIPGLEIAWVVMSADGVRRGEAERSANEFLQGVSSPNVKIHDFRDGFFPYVGESLKEAFEGLKHFDPDLVFTHFRDDRHQDHRLVSELTWNTFRATTILEYEIPKYDGDFGVPNVFLSVSKECAKAKIATIMRCFPSQSNRDWFDEELFGAVLRLRGMEARSSSGYAEAFYGRKLAI